jgi:hypothetical protein
MPGAPGLGPDGGWGVLSLEMGVSQNCQCLRIASRRRELKRQQVALAWAMPSLSGAPGHNHPGRCASRSIHVVRRSLQRMAGGGRRCLIAGGRGRPAAGLTRPPKAVARFMTRMVGVCWWFLQLALHACRACRLPASGQT